MVDKLYNLLNSRNTFLLLTFFSSSKFSIDMCVCYKSLCLRFGEWGSIVDLKEKQKGDIHQTMELT